MGWEPERYLQFADERLRPAQDLLARIPLPAPARVVDLGCGPGNVTRLLAGRWPRAQITGVDASAAMLERARPTLPEARFELADIRHWTPAEAPDLIFSNAALHWLDDHPSLFPRLLSLLAPGGVLAVQMPGNFDAPSHRLIRELAAAPAWAEMLTEARMGAVLGMSDYHHLLAPHCTQLALWESIYWQRLSGPAPVLDWLRGTTLLPYLAPLTTADQARLLAELAPQLAEAYPPDASGTTLFPFRRIFLVACR
ncbi:MAG: trans-aconitate 2-methyltransferase [Zoogloea sp.]|jgi:trans-aconitate 2-methyltransferase|nr:trans-aconitate 2-methyltransferase [Zoogloea sp.]